MGVNQIYKGGSYNFDYGDDPFGKDGPIVGGNYRVNASQLGLTTRPDVANQLSEASRMLSTGAKTIELTGISPQVIEAMPKQQFKEIERLKKLVGADITFHGPLIEPTGVTQNGWDEPTRKQAERQIWDAVARSQALNPEGNTVVTLHTSNGLMSPSIRMFLPDEKGEKKEVITNLAVIDERTGRLGYLPKPKPNQFLGIKGGEAVDELKKLNQENWDGELNNLSIETMRGRQAIQDGLKLLTKGGEGGKLSEWYKTYKDDRARYNREMDIMYKKDPVSAQVGASIAGGVESLSYGEVFVRDSYRKLQELYNKAYAAAEISKEPNAAEQIRKLDEYREQAAKQLDAMQDDSLKIKEFSEGVFNGISLLANLYQNKAPETFRPLKDFAVEKASETFGNVAFSAYKQFGDHAPILSLENPPVGMGLSRADEIRDLVKATQKHFVDRAMNEEGLSEKEAKEQAKKLIGVTWDVGHINMIRKFGYGNEELVNETKQIKEFVKHVHLSDNFGLEHTELPMGMGNVPLKEHLKELGDKAAKAKHIIETGAWYNQTSGFSNISPLPIVMHAMGSPIYPMQMQPYWNTASDMSGAPGYFSGYGLNPEVHHSIYGSGFAGLPAELGGSMPGRGSRLGGTPME